MLEPWNRTNWSHKQSVTAFLNTAAFFIRKLKIAPIIAGWFHFKPSAASICLFHSGFLRVYDTVILFQMKSALKKCLLPSPTFTPDVPNCPLLFPIRRTHGNLPASLPSPSASLIFGKVNTIHIANKSLQLLGIFFFKEMFITCVIFLWIAHEILSTTTLSSWCRILLDSLLRLSLRRHFSPSGSWWTLWPLAKPAPFLAFRVIRKPSTGGSMCD